MKTTNERQQRVLDQEIANAKQTIAEFIAYAEKYGPAGAIAQKGDEATEAEVALKLLSADAAVEAVSARATEILMANAYIYGYGHAGSCEAERNAARRVIGICKTLQSAD